jgi:hypothetical protein
MAAAPFTATMIFRGQKSRTVKHVRCTISDVAAAYWIYPDGSNTLTLPSSEGWDMVDIIVVTGGTDTTQSQLYVNQLNTGLVVDHKSNLNTANFRQFITNPIGFNPGSQLKLVQAA